MTKFNDDFIFFTEKIKSGEPFAYARYADGEVALMKGVSVGPSSQAFQVDRWLAPDQLTKVGEGLLESITHTEDNYYYAISAHSDNIGDYEFLKSHLKTDKLTFANLWINANYQKMKEFYSTLDKSVYVICNHEARPDRFPFKVTEIFPFPDNCILYWEEHGEDYITQLLDYISQLSGETIFVSAGPVSEILIDRMYKANPNNQYIDVGSSLGEYIHGYKTRPYMDENSQYSKEISFFYE
jgi:hypothetical protein